MSFGSAYQVTNGVRSGDTPPLSVFVTATVSESQTATVSRKPYDAIFCSYSRKDIAIVQRVERAYRALGNTYMRDMISLRSGEEWSDGLIALMDKADIFQLFWSSESCKSSHVKMEWDYALKLAASRDHFIRPVYWENPMPPVPDVPFMRWENASPRRQTGARCRRRRS